MSKGWTIALTVLGAMTVLALGAVMLLIASLDPTLRGLRPHAVYDDLKTYSVPTLASLTEDPQFEAILIRDEWYEKDGASGWFALTGESLRDDSLRFALRGALDYNPVIFVSGPKSCGVGQPRKAIIALEPSRQDAGFAGRSTCSRPKMDVQALISRATPVERHVWSEVPQSKYLELRKRVLTNPDSGVLLGPIGRKIDEVPYTRRINLPVMVDSQERPGYKTTGQLRDHLKTLSLPNGVSASVSYNSLYGSTSDVLHVVYVNREGSLLALEGLKLLQPFVEFRCTESAKAYCAGLTADVLPRKLNTRRLTAEQVDALLASASQANDTEHKGHLTVDEFKRSSMSLGPLRETRVSFAFYKLLTAE